VGVWTLALALVAGLAVLGWTWRHPTAFPEAGGWGVGSHQRPVGAPFYVGMTSENHDARGTVTIHSARAHVVRDSAAAEIEFFVCTVDPSSGVGSIGAVPQSEIHHECSALVPAEGAKMRLNATPRQQVVMAVSLSHAGRVKVEGLDLDYSHGWQHGTQRTGGEVDLGSRQR
jgi:hypothetical protein